jgi:diaminohydroxyphosphoribosylaminopyrimidine deaminase/5-amino-6-(5-phosphoribosylamino)uracil reductase
MTSRQPNEPPLWARLLALAAGKEGPEPPDGHGENESFWRLYAPVAGGRADPAYVIGQLGQSLDGRIATPTGHSHYINGPEAILHLHRLRALADAVIVGAGTIIADDPRLTVRLVSGPNPARVAIDPTGRLPATAKLFADDGARRFVVQSADRPLPAGVTGITLAGRDGRIDPHDIVAALAKHGLRRLLIEGGGHTVSAFLSAGALDRLHLCVAPLVIGSGPVGIALPPIDRLEAALRPAIAIHRLGQDVLFDCAFARASAPEIPAG